ncbi:uncharacterized protein LOC124453188 [Xenia sp. Carnegie-2017]|uniref:uncharacterized protein LOC124453188 n=1 Tax=Xenia sp. Carnegie-2017 TaxID=2897299 RepID=UPI001F03EBE8|nr:uncharacterized protein LOC124453188 [Xenia sp. Carnegie-2017]
MEVEGEQFLRRKFLHLFQSYQHTRPGVVIQEDAKIHGEQLDNILRKQLQSRGMSNDLVEQRVEEFNAGWLRPAFAYFSEMVKFSKNPEAISEDEFVQFKMSIRDYIRENGVLPPWFENSLRMSYEKCWANDKGLLTEDSMELLPGVTSGIKSVCHQHLTENNNKTIDLVTFLCYVKDFYCNEDPNHVSKFIHGYVEQ